MAGHKILISPFIFLLYHEAYLVFIIEFFKKFFQGDPMTSIFDLIRNGVQLKPITHDSPPPSMTDSHQQLLRNTLANINRVTHEMSPDIDSNDEGEFDD